MIVRLVQPPSGTGGCFATEFFRDVELPETYTLPPEVVIGLMQTYILENKLSDPPRYRPAQSTYKEPPTLQTTKPAMFASARGETTYYLASDAGLYFTSGRLEPPWDLVDDLASLGQGVERGRIEVT
jgi:hypothetical protein